MKYLIIDGSLNSTGIRNKIEGGYITPEELKLSLDIQESLRKWLLKYENEHYYNFANEEIIKDLDREGREIALKIKGEMSNVKIEYYSNAKMTSEMM